MKKIWYPWLNNIYKDILLNYINHKAHHSLLLKSRKYNGSKILLYAISRWLICENPNNFKCCNQCLNCRLAINNRYTNFYELKQKKKISIEQIRDIKYYLYNATNITNKKILLIYNISNLTYQSINALLKIVEEPPKNTYFLFNCEYIHNIPETFISRCSIWNLHKPKEKLSLFWLKKRFQLNIKNIKTILNLCDGYPILAQIFINLKIYKKRLLFLITLKNVIKNNNYIYLLSILNNDNKYIIFNIMFSILLDALKLSLNIKYSIINIDQIKLINYITKKWNFFILNDIINIWVKYKKKMSSKYNLNKKIYLTLYLMTWQNIINLIKK